jgi:serine/threonine-protein kinase
MSSIYRAQDILSGTKVVVKLCVNGEKLKDFQQEIRILRSCTHPAIQKVLAAGTYHDCPYYVMPFHDGNNLREYLDTFFSITEQEVLELFLQITDAVAYLHKHNIVHNDLKPQNILIEPGGRIILSDFGLSTRVRPFHRRRTVPDSIWGSPVYLAPELAEGKPPSFSSDVYSLGVILFLLYTGFPPFIHEDMDLLIKMHQTLPPPAPHLITPTISSSMNAIILRCLSKQPRDRFKNAAELHNDVSSFLDAHKSQSEQTVIQRRPDMISIDQKTRKLRDGSSD